MSDQTPGHEPGEESWMCPSSSASDPNASIFGVVVGSEDEPKVAYLAKPIALETQRDQLPPDVDPREVYRLSGRCVGSGCLHYSGHHCKLGEYLTATLDAVVSQLPPCSIRQSCRWFHEQRARACLRCPQVVTQVATKPASSRAEGKRQLPVV